jgi:nitroimidazol reductase NimA-like FMN-containing flavoprotein (pyridoxamine 5'-phosphate oxidase superfamily)
VGREQIALTRDELTTFLAAQRWVTLATLDADGTPAAEIVPAVLDGERLCFAVARGSHAHENVERDPRVACAADEFPSYYEIRGVTVHGRAESRAPGDRLGADWVEYAVPLDDTFSFDFRKIRSKY